MENYDNHYIFPENPAKYSSGKNIVLRIGRRVWLWANATRLRKILSSILALLILFTSVRFIFLKPKEVKAADTFIKFDEGSGNSAGDTGGSIAAGKILGPTWRTDDMCRDEKCLYFDGDQDLVLFQDDGDLDFASSDSFTVSGWFRMPENTSGGDMVLVNKLESDGDDGGYRVDIASDGNISCEMEDADAGNVINDVITSTSGPYDNNKWHHFACVKNGTTSLTLYLDGLQVAQDTSISATQTLANNDPLTIGLAGNLTGADFKGFIDEIKIYRSVRTVDQIKTDMLETTANRGAGVSFGPDQSYLSNGLVGYWNLDDTATPSLDYSGLGKSGTWSGNTSAVTGKFSRAADFDGTDDNISIGDFDEYSFNGTNTFSASAWVYPDSVTGDRYFVSKGTTSNYEWGLFSSGTSIRAIIWQSGGSTMAVAVGNNAVSTGSWQHFAFTVDLNNNDLRLFKNGVEVATTNSFSGSYTNGTASMRMGERADGTGDVDGRVDEVRLYNRQLSSSEIQSIYNWGPGPIGYWPMDDNRGGPANTSDMLVYRQGTDDTPIYRRHDATWGSEGTALDVDSENLFDIEWARIVQKPSETSDEKILCTDDSGDDVNCQVWNGSAWGNLQEFSTNANGGQGFDVAYESVSGRGLVCYASPTDSSTPFCQIWNGSSWAAADTAEDLTNNVLNFKLIPDPNSDYIAMISRDGDDDVDAQIWNGSVWANLQSLETLTADNNLNFPMEGVWDSSGNFMALWYSNADGDLEARQYSKTTGWGSEMSSVITGLQTASLAAWVQADAHPSNGYIVAAIAADNDTLEAIYWNGSSWTGHTQLEDAFATGITNNDNLFDVAYEKSGDFDAIITYGGSNTTLKYRIFDTLTSSFGSEQSLPTSSDAGLDWHQLATDPHSDSIMLTLQGNVDAVDTIEWNGNNWEAAVTNQEATGDDQVSNAWFTYDYRPDIADKSTNGNGARMEVSMDNPWVPGKFGSGLDFDGTDDYVEVSNPNLPTTDFTYSFWAKLDVISDESLIYSTDGSSSDELRIVSETGGADVRLNNVDVVTNFHVFSANVWTHIAVTRSGSNVTAYVNGAPAGTGTDGTALTFSTCSLYFGTELDGGCTGSTGVGNFADGAMDDIKVYNYARTTEQIIVDMNGGHPAPGSPVGSALGYWKFDEGANNTCSGGTNDNCNSGSQGTTLDGAGTSTTLTNSGKFGKALTFSGSTSYVQVADNAAIDFTGDFTISAWVARSGGTNGYILSKTDASSDGGYALLHGGSGEVYCRTVNGSGFNDSFTTTGLVNSDSIWHHVVAVRSGTSCRVYVDGFDRTSTAATHTTMTANAKNLRIGGPPTDGTGSFFTGKIDEVKLYNIALTADQVKIEYNRGSASMGSTSTDSSGVASMSTENEYCPPGQGSTCTPPIGEWKFDENTGTTAYDTTGTGNNGSFGDSPKWIQGKNGSGLSFDGSDDYIQAATSGSTTFDQLSQLSVEAWIYSRDASPADAARIIGKNGASSGSGWRLQQSVSGNRLIFAAIGTGTNLAASTETNVISQNQWYHVAATWTGDIADYTSAKIYVNGIQVPHNASQSTNGVAPRIDDSSNELCIGSKCPTSLIGMFDGIIDDVKVYNYIRTPAQIAWSYNQGDPAGWWKFDENTGTTANDSSGFGSNMTLSASSWSTGKYNTSWNGDGAKWASVADASTGDRFDFAATEDFAISMWVKSDSSTNPSSTEYVLSKAESSPGYRIWIPGDSSGNITFGIDEDSTWTPQDSVTSTTDIYDTNWHHIVAMKQGTSKIQLYIDGHLHSEDTSLAADLTLVNSVSLVVGDRSGADGGDEFFGDVDDLRIFRYMLTAQQIKNLYNENATLRFGPASGTP